MQLAFQIGHLRRTPKTLGYGQQMRSGTGAYPPTGGHKQPPFSIDGQSYCRECRAGGMDESCSRARGDGSAPSYWGFRKSGTPAGVPPPAIALPIWMGLRNGRRLIVTSWCCRLRRLLQATQGREATGCRTVIPSQVVPGGCGAGLGAGRAWCVTGGTTAGAPVSRHPPIPSTKSNVWLPLSCST